ncbi:MAG TPA: Spy/CpxP family protein refolding chaperone [Xanthobacteraceae bacterium]|nr:Spy/CpxP family protein refolding chaperone [Xanthobacteraceae bacterium]
MTMRSWTPAGICLAAFLTIPSAGQAQEGWRGWGPGMMMGPGMMHARGFGAICSPQGAGLAEWQIQRIERSVKPNEEQAKKLANLRTASTKAAETIRSACPRDFPSTSSARLELMEKRMEAMLQGVKTVRPAFDDFYNSLSAEQKTKLDGTGPRRWGWRFWRGNERP